MKKKKAIIVDIDGTLSDSTQRQKYMLQSPKDWKSFYAEIPNDLPNQWCVEICTAMSWAGYEVILVSGRPNDYREVTNEWLNKHFVYSDRLLMRESGDFRPDYQVKLEILNKLKKNYEILFAVDDRKQVVDMWRDNGVVCLHCAEGDF